MELVPEFTDLLDRYLLTKKRSEDALERFRNEGRGYVQGMGDHFLSPEVRHINSIYYRDYLQAQQDLNNAFAKVRAQ